MSIAHASRDPSRSIADHRPYTDPSVFVLETREVTRPWQVVDRQETIAAAEQRVAKKASELARRTEAHRNSDDTWYWVLAAVIPLGWPILAWRGVDALVDVGTPWPPTASESAALEVTKVEGELKAAQAELAALRRAENGSFDVVRTGEGQTSPLRLALGPDGERTTRTDDSIERRVQRAAGRYRAYHQATHINRDPRAARRHAGEARTALEQARIAFEQDGGTLSVAERTRLGQRIEGLERQVMIADQKLRGARG